MANQTGWKIKTVVSNNGGEFVNKQFDYYIHEKGIEA
jgi:hypothetical protein